MPLFFAQSDMTGAIRTGRRPLLEFLFVTQGGFDFTVGGHARRLEAGDLALINAHFDNWGDLREPLDRYACVSFFIGDCRVLDDLGHEPLFEVSRLSDRVLVHSLYRHVAELHMAPRDAVREFRVKAAVLELLSFFVEQLTHGTAGPDGSPLGRALAFVSANHADPELDLDRIAEAVHVSPPHLCRLMTARTGLSPMRYVEQFRLNRAADLLQRTEFPIKRIADMVGYRDQLYFTRVFRKRFGMPPGQYRQQLRPARPSV